MKKILILLLVLAGCTDWGSVEFKGINVTNHELANSENYVKYKDSVYVNKEGVDDFDKIFIMTGDRKGFAFLDKDGSAQDWSETYKALTSRFGKEDLNTDWIFDYIDAEPEDIGYLEPYIRKGDAALNRWWNIKDREIQVVGLSWTQGGIIVDFYAWNKPIGWDKAEKK